MKSIGMFYIETLSSWTEHLVEGGERMFEFLIGTRFYYKGKLVEVKENSGEPCSDCVFKPIRHNLYCKQNCDSQDRHDKKYVIFKEVKDE